MGRSYAGILGLLGFSACLVRGAVHGSGTHDTLFQAWASMLIFVAIGYVAGRLAGWMVEETVRSKAAAQTAAHADSEAAASKTAA